jgi:predicted dehydrogenase
MYVVGDEGALTVEGDEVVVYTPDGQDRRPVPTWNAPARELGAWLDLCRNGKDAGEWQREGLGTLDLISAYKQAYETGETVSLAQDAGKEG